MFLFFRIYLKSTLSLLGFWTLSSFFINKALLQFSRRHGANSAYLWCTKEQNSITGPISDILSLHSTNPWASSPKYLVRFSPFISFISWSFCPSLKVLHFLTNAVFFLRLLSSLYKWRSSSGLKKIFYSFLRFEY